MRATIRVISIRVGRPETGGPDPPSRAGRVTAPPRSTPSGDHGGALAAALDPSLGASESIRYQLFPVPGNFTVVEASWSALARSPGPRKILVSPDAERREWF